MQGQTPNRPQPPALEIRDLRFSYPAVEEEPARELFAGLDYTLEPGAMGVILGGADAGKTTLSRICANLVPRFTGGRLSGTVMRDNRRVADQKPYDCVESLGLVFQDPEEQTFTTRCDTEVAFALESLGIARGEMEERIEASLGLMGLQDYASRSPATLSGGEKKRLLIACCAAVDPPFWILDEVFQELDAEWKTRLLDCVAERRATTLFLDSRWSELYASRCGLPAVLHDGRIVPSDIERDALLARHGLILPPSPRRNGAAGGNTEPLIRAEGLSFSFGASGPFALAIDGLELKRGEVCALVGRNGSGKSTLGRLLCGLLAPDQGVLSLADGRGFHRAAGSELQYTVGYLFQNPDYQVFLPTVAEELAFGLRAAGVPEDRARDRVEEAIRLFHLPHGRTPPALMSYGARKRLQAATFHLLGREMLILDEIDAGLSYGEFLPLIDLLASTGAGIVFITHDMALARGIADRIIVMEGGRMIRDCARDGFSGLMPGGAG